MWFPQQQQRLDTFAAAGFWADFKQRIIDRAINEWRNDCGSIRTRVVAFDTAK